MLLPKQWFFILILIITVGARAGWSWLPQSNPAAAATPTPAPTAASDDISYNPSPDGRWMAIVNSTAGSLDLEQPDGQTVNIFPPGSTVNTITWSPDSRHLLVVRTNWVFNQPEGTGVSSSGPIAIWQVEIEADKVQPAKQVFQSSTPAGQDAAEQILFGHWSPNSLHVLFWLGPLGASILADGLPLSVLNVTTGQVTQVAAWALLNPRYQSWAPDSSALVLTAGAGREAQINKWLNLFEVASGQITTVISQTEQIPGIVAWSPRDDLIAYAAVLASETSEDLANPMTFDNPAIAARRIYLLDPATGQSRRLNQADTFQDAPLWSDDDATLYYMQREADNLVLMAANPLTGQAQAVPNVSMPLPEFVGYYGQSDLDSLLAYRPGGELAMSPTPAATATPPPPSAADMEIVRFIFKNHPPELGTLTEEFLQKVEVGEYRDFTLQEVDLTGDGTPEILVSGRADTFHLFVAILTRDSAGELRELFYTANTNSKYVGEVRATVQEQQVIADFLTATGGAGYLEMTWEQRWIECQGYECELVWLVPLIRADRAVNVTIERHYAVTEVEQPNAETIHLTTRRFGLAIPALVEGEGGARPDITRRIVGPDTLETFRRAEPGGIYRLESQTQPGPGQEIAREFDLQTAETNNLVFEILSQPFSQADDSFDSEGLYQAQAELWGLPAPDQPDDPTWGSAVRQPDIAIHTGPPGQLGEWIAGVISALDTPQCRLTALRQTAGKFQQIGRVDVPCTANLTHLAWADVTGDGSDELLLLTIPPDAETGGRLQRLHVYTTTGNKLVELTTLDGFINGADGAGIRWEDTAEGFKVQAGRPLIDPDAFPGFSAIRLEREFQTYVWDEGSNEFKVTE